MKLTDAYKQREIMGDVIFVPKGEKVLDFNGLITMNEMGAFIWKLIENGLEFDEILSRIVAEYDVSEAQAREDLNSFIEELRDKEIIE